MDNCMGYLIAYRNGRWVVIDPKGFVWGETFGTADEANDAIEMAHDQEI